MMQSQYRRQYVFCMRFLVQLLGTLYLMSAGSVYAQVSDEELSEMLEHELLNLSVPRIFASQEIADSDNQAVPAEQSELSNSRTENDLLITQNPMTPIEQELWKARISTLPASQSSQPKNELKKIIDEITSIRIKEEVLVADISTETEKIVKIEAQSAIVDFQQDPNQTGTQVEKSQAEEAIYEQVLHQFKELSESPERLANPLELAEILYKGNYIEESVVCYREAMRRINTNESDVFQDKAWILLQLGNCLTETDPKAALENYQIIIAEFPYSPWAQLAKGKSDLITWYLKEDPKKLLEESKIEMNR